MKKIIVVSLICLVGFVSCAIFGNKIKIASRAENDRPESSGKLEKILSKKELRVVLDLNSTNYFVYKGEPMGFEYDLLSEFCAEKNLKLKIFVNRNLTSSIEGLITGKYDLIAKNVIPGCIQNDSVSFTVPVLHSGMVLVQRKSEVKNDIQDDTSLKNLLGENNLEGKTIIVPSGSIAALYLKTLSANNARKFIVAEDSLKGTKQLVSEVSSGKIDFTVISSKNALALKSGFSDLDFSVTLGPDQEFSWVVTRNSSKFKKYMNEWLAHFSKSEQYARIYARYFSGNQAKIYSNSEYNSLLGGRLSKYDETIKEISAVYQWDWRLISSIILQESNFDPSAESHKGAVGLMQLMPLTAEQYEVKNLNEPRENIRGGVEYLTWLDEIFAPIIPDKTERLKFVLASYNAGVGHVMDARKLAMKYNKNPSVWDNNVDYFLLNKSAAKFYNDPVVKWGYCRGHESTNYVSDILKRYQSYVNLVPPAENRSLAALASRK